MHTTTLSDLQSTKVTDGREVLDTEKVTLAGHFTTEASRAGPSPRPPNDD
jgi:hypothetical protein